SLEDVLREAGIGPSRIHRMFARPESDLDAEKQIAESRSGRKLADLNLYYDIAVPAGVSIEALCDALNALPSVELAAPAPLPARTPSDMAPATPDYQDVQGYRLNAPQGIGASEVNAVAGADGGGGRRSRDRRHRVRRGSRPRRSGAGCFCEHRLGCPLRSLSAGRGQPWHRGARGSRWSPQRLRRDGAGARGDLARGSRDDDFVWLQRRARREPGRTNLRARRCHPDRAAGLRVRRGQLRRARVG